MEAGSATPASQEASREQTIVLLGNDAPQMMHPEFAQNKDGEWRPTGTMRSVPHPFLRQNIIRMEMQPDFDDQEHVDRALSTDNDRFLSLIARNLPDQHKLYAIGIQHIEQSFPIHSTKSKPSWVDSNNKEFAEAISEYFDGIPIGQPTNLLVHNGTDHIHNASFSTSAQPAAANYMALANSTTATTPLVTDTTLTGEITTSGGGLIRGQGTVVHSGGTNITTITKTFTANGTDALAVTVSQMAIFNAVTAGTLVWKTALNSNATLTTSGDNVTVTETITG